MKNDRRIKGIYDRGAARGIEPRRPRLLEQVHEAIRRRYFSRRTEEAYAHWIRRFIHFSGRRHPRCRARRR